LSQAQRDCILGFSGSKQTPQGAAKDSAEGQSVDASLKIE